MISAPATRLRLAAAALALCGYVAFAFGAQDAYPFYRFDMFSWPMRTPVGRVMAQTASGETRAVHDFVDWVCDRPPTDALVGESRGCPPYVRGDRFEREVLLHLTRHAAASPEAARGGIPVQLVRRVVAVSELNTPVPIGCAIATCTARLAGDP